jgi:hypothetical protein
VTDGPRGIVLFGDIVDSRRDPGSTVFLRSLCAELESAYDRSERLAGFGFTQGDELQGLLSVGSDPFRAVLRAALRPDARPMRWVVIAGELEPGRGPATERTGPAFHVAREVLARAKARRDGLVVRSGDAATDELLEDLTPLIGGLLDGLTTRQREIGRLLLVEGLRQSGAAERLGITRATVSVVADRGRIRHLAGLLRAVATLFARGIAEAGHGDRPEPRAVTVGRVVG